MSNLWGIQTLWDSNFTKRHWCPDLQILFFTPEFLRRLFYTFTDYFMTYFQLCRSYKASSIQKATVNYEWVSCGRNKSWLMKYFCMTLKRSTESKVGQWERRMEVTVLQIRNKKYHKLFGNNVVLFQIYSSPLFLLSFLYFFFSSVILPSSDLGKSLRVRPAVPITT